MLIFLAHEENLGFKKRFKGDFVENLRNALVELSSIEFSVHSEVICCVRKEYASEF